MSATLKRANHIMAGLGYVSALVPPKHTGGATTHSIATADYRNLTDLQKAMLLEAMQTETAVDAPIDVTATLKVSRISKSHPINLSELMANSAKWIRPNSGKIIRD